MEFRWKVTQIRETPKDFDIYDYKNPGKLIGEKRVLQFRESKWYSDGVWEDVYDFREETIYLDKKGTKNG